MASAGVSSQETATCWEVTFYETMVPASLSVGPTFVASTTAATTINVPLPPFNASIGLLATVVTHGCSHLRST
eukprot:m.195578 g.195578  ORF g.195578 m.195578 type:complete len:73 (+) comp15233_c0_seq1:1284-1502(+)